MKRLILLALALALLCSGCTLRNRMSSELAIPDVMPTGTIFPATQTEAETYPPVNPDNNGIPVREVFNEQGSYTDQFGLTRSYKYVLPYADISSVSAIRVNNEIEQVYRKTIDEQLRLMELLEPLNVSTIDYSAYTNGTILTILVREITVLGRITTAAYNLDTITGSKVTGNLLVQQAGLTEEEFLSLVRQSISEWFIANYAQYEQADALLYTTKYEQSVSEDNYGLDMPIFLGEDGALNILATIYTVKGSGTECVRLLISPQ